jgi:hypothetical protein
MATNADKLRASSVKKTHVTIRLNEFIKVVLNRLIGTLSAEVLFSLKLTDCIDKNSL